MSDRVFNVALLDADPVFRLGLRRSLESTTDLRVISEAETEDQLLQFLADGEPPDFSDPSATPASMDVLTLDLASIGAGLEWCQRFKVAYPQVALVLISVPQSRETVLAALRGGVRGYCPKGSSVEELVFAIRQVALGQVYLADVFLPSSIAPIAPVPNSPLGPFALIRQRTRNSGLRQIDQAIVRVDRLLQNSGIPWLDRLVLEGQQRELRTARWLVNRLLATSPRLETPVPEVAPAPLAAPTPLPLEVRPSALVPTSDGLQRTTPVPNRAHLIQSALMDATVAKLQTELTNRTSIPLELDIFRNDKKRELLFSILRRLEEILSELRFSQVTPDQVMEKRLLLLQDLWQAATTDLFGRYYTLEVGGGRSIEVVGTLLQEREGVQREILEKIPLTGQLLNHLLFETPLTVDQTTAPAGSPEAMGRAEALLHHLLIQVGNAVIQPLLNNFADLEEIKGNFYDRRLLSTREIERFRNQLSWKYRLEHYFQEPKAIFESQYSLLILTDSGIRQTSIYGHRREELDQLRGVPLVVTLMLEARDAIAPRVRSAVSFLGSSLVYVLTEVVGRGIGLIGRGIVQGLGSVGTKR